MLPLKATHNADYADEIQSAKDWLVAAQWDAGEGISESDWQWGGFGYGRNVRPDLSNTQFAMMGLDAADLANPNETFTKVQKFASRCQNRTASNEGYSTNNDGGFNYLPGQSVVGGVYLHR